MFSRTQIRLFTVMLLVLCATGTVSTAQEPSVSEVIQGRMDILGAQRSLKIQEVDIRAVLALPLFYEKRGFEPEWTEPEKIEELRKAIDASIDDGLVPGDYHRRALDALIETLETTSSPENIADLDILCTDAFLSLAYHTDYGVADPEMLDSDWNIYSDMEDLPTVIEWMNDVVDGGSGSITRAIDDLRPPYEIYRALSRALVEYRRIEKDGGWPVIPDGKVLKEGMQDQRVITMRERLAVTGDLETEGLEGDLFDEKTMEGVKKFQQRHGLDVDGAVGKNTLKFMNMPVSDKIDMIRVNLDRLRWVTQDDSETYIVVNIAGFEVYFIREDELAWQSRAQVGKEYRKTPIFRANLDYIVFNPTWTVPPTILKKDMIPKAAKDPSYLDGKNIKVIDGKGKVIPSTDVDWNRYLKGGFPYTLRQDPGPNNALGMVKFIFPNKHFVFLHDTPSRSLFSRSKRTFSSGCIRVEHPLDLAEVLLNDPKKWSAEKIDQLIESAETKTVHLKEPVPVFLLYWTAFVLQDNRVHFCEDIYGRDAAVLKELDKEFYVRARHRKQRTQ